MVEVAPASSFSEVAFAQWGLPAPGLLASASARPEGIVAGSLSADIFYSPAHGSC